MKRVMMILLAAALLGAGYECEELLDGETPSGELPVCCDFDSVREATSGCTTDTDCLDKCLEEAFAGDFNPACCD